MDSMVNPTQYAEGGAPETFPYSGAETPPYEPFENNYPGNEPMASNPYGLRQLPPTYTDPSATDIGDKPWVNYSSPGAGGISDLLSRYGKYLPALARGIGSVAGGLAGAKSGKQTQALGREQIALGAPSRARYEQMSANPGEWAKANLSGLLDNAADTLGRKWSVSEGNPAESPRAIMGTGKSLAALQWQMEQAEKELQERAGARGLEGYGPVLAGQQERSRAITGGIGGVLDTIFNPDRQADTKTNAIVALIKQFPELFLQKG